jgi:aspartate aminotransferase-like enzyme
MAEEMERLVPLEQLLPRETRLLAGVGPTPISSRVQRALTLGLGIDHLGDPMTSITTQIMIMLKVISGVPADQTEQYIALCAYGAATGAMEMALNGIVWPGTRVLACVNGSFSARMADICRRLGGQVETVEAELGKPIPFEMTQTKLTTDQQYHVLTIGHGETSTGVLNKDTAMICQLAKQYGLITVVDGVCTIPCIFLSMAESGVDILFGGSQKGFAAVPGASPVVFSPIAWQRVKARPTPCPSYVFDPQMAYQFWTKKGYHVTAPVQVILALHEALWEILEEGLPVLQKRHKVASRALQVGLETAGFELYTDERWRLPTAVAIKFGEPDGDSESVRSQLRNRLKTEGIVIAGAFGGLPIFRVGCMGWQAQETHVRKLVWALATVAKEFGFDTHRYQASQAIQKVFRKNGFNDPFQETAPPEIPAPSCA